MKRIMIVVAAVILLGGCGLLGGKSDLQFSMSDTAASAGLAARGGIPKAAANISKVYFRSSDIEMWHVESAADVSKVFSNKYRSCCGYSVDLDYDQGRSLEYKIGDDTESVVFLPAKDHVVDVTNRVLNLSWRDRIGKFIAAGNTKISMMRLDIGAGSISINDGNTEVPVRTENDGDGAFIDANSIIFIDRSLLSQPVLVTRSQEWEIIADTLTASDLGISESEFEVVKALHQSSNTNNDETPIDVNGALIIPMTPLDLVDMNTETDGLVVNVVWDMSGAYYESGGVVYCSDRVAGYPYYFSVTVDVIPYE